MTRLSGEIIRASDVSDLTLVETTTGATPLSGWAVDSFQSDQCGGVCSITLIVHRTGATITTDTSGNITDSSIATIPAPIPLSTRYPCFDKGGIAGGTAVISSVSGTVTIKTLFGSAATIASGDVVSISDTYVTG